ncbi:linear amide C-N hydrolase [Paraferrimonas sedimenticola]|uniref:Choloylglycine hydrolase n=1 Tax=Paraferrimonas sedimenticola TaxID=375674 RepID=A0AA37W2H5_9GAMM|nr:linear amide C-N hydrolase [Paraferrimonas sedimenticola]GLP97618.1 choloylglycine hydrolase [Paraferrimonas sedimenticola]
MKFVPAIVVASVLLSVSITVSACTFFVFKNDLGNHFAGRTLEWPGTPPAAVALVPRGHKLGAVTTKFGFVGMHHHGMFTDGMNEHGLLVNALWLDASEYGGNKEEDVKITDAVAHILGNAKTVSDAVAYLNRTTFYTFSSKVTSGLDIKFHFAITQPDGQSAVVEFIDGKPITYTNELKVLTNDPTYDKHIAAWNKRSPSELDEEAFVAFDYSPEDRFIKMAAFNFTQTSVPTDEDGVNRAWSMVNTVDIPQGATYWKFVNDLPMTTTFSTVADLTNLSYYFRTYDNYDIRKIDLAKIDFGSRSYASVDLFKGADYGEFNFKK